MEEITLKAKKRPLKPNRMSGRIRRQGGIPCIYYGLGKESMPLEVNAKEIAILIRKHRENHIINLEIEGAGEADTKAIIKDMQKDVIKGTVLHIDFQHISMDQKITVDTPLEFLGDAVGVKTGGGVLQILMRTIKIECLPKDLREKISIDVSNLDLGQTLHVGDIIVPNATVLNGKDEVVATITTVKEEVFETAVAAPDAATEPEVIKKGKKLEEGAEGADAAKKPEEQAQDKGGKEKPAAKEKK